MRHSGNHPAPRGKLLEDHTDGQGRTVPERRRGHTQRPPFLHGPTSETTMQTTTHQPLVFKGITQMPPSAILQPHPRTSYLPFTLQPLLSAPPSLSPLIPPSTTVITPLGTPHSLPPFSLPSEPGGPLFSMPGLEQLGPAERKHTIGQTRAPKNFDHQPPTSTALTSDLLSSFYTPLPFPHSSQLMTSSHTYLEKPEAM